MCGRYRLSRRKQIVEEYFDSVSRKTTGSALQRRADPARPSHPPASKGTRPRIVADALGTDSVMGKRPFGCGTNDKREVGDSKHEARVPRFAEISQVPDSR